MKISKKIVGFNVNTGDDSGNSAADNGALENGAPASDSAKAAPAKADVIQMHETLQRPEKLIGSTYKLKVPDHVSNHAMYITIAHLRFSSIPKTLSTTSGLLHSH